MKIYIPSTFLELWSYRRKAQIELIGRGYEVEVLSSLEGLSDAEIVSVLRARVVECDALVLLVGERRGSVPEVNGLEDSSFTKVEYDAALEANLPILIFHIGYAKRVNNYNDRVDGDSRRLTD